MKAGEYVGKDGRTYRWTNRWKNDGSYALCVVDYKNETEWRDQTIPPADWPAAKSALDALIEQEKREIVELGGGTCCRLVISGDNAWIEENTAAGYVKKCSGYFDAAEMAELAYRKGRETAQQEAAEMRDAARELVEAVLALHPARNREGIFTGTACVMSDALWRAIEAAGTLEVQL